MMDGRGGCCIAPYAAGVYDMSKVDRIMLRYRPIAPKPAAGGSVSSGSSPENSEANAGSGRGMRKYVKRGKKSSNKRCRNSNKGRKSSSDETDPGQNSSSTGGSISGGDPAATLPLLPETPDRRDSPARGSPNERQTIWLSFSNNDNINTNRKINDNHEAFDAGRVSSGLDRTAVVTTPQPTRVVGSIVTVESVADSWADAHGLGRKDEERVRSLKEDACPGFVSDGYNRVGWTNGAYREMVGGGEEVVVWLVVKERVPVTCPAFTCKMRVQYACGKERSSVVVPCDAWRMDGGGFAWRLDVKAALSLGR